MLGFKTFREKLKSFNWTIFILFFLLLVFGLTIQYSLSLGLERETFFIFKKHLIFILLGIFFFFLFSFIDFRILNSVAFFLYFFTLILLSFVLVFGKTLQGVKGWFFFGPIYFQPVELAKIVLVIILAKILAERAKRGVKVKEIFLNLIILFPFILLIFFQPDLGSALILLFVWLMMIVLNVRKIKYILYIFIIFLLTSLIFWHFVFKDYQKARIITFFSPHQDPFGRGYQITQAKIAIGAGKLFGRGIGYGSQAQMRFLPASRTDFVFAAFAEEFGFLGTSFLIFLFSLIFLKIVKISKSVYDDFGFFLILGLAFNLFIQVLISIGMNLGLLPVVGIPLPFISYGGSSLLMNSISLGIIQSIIIHQKFTKREEIL